MNKFDCPTCLSLSEELARLTKDFISWQKAHSTGPVSDNDKWETMSKEYFSAKSAHNIIKLATGNMCCQNWIDSPVIRADAKVLAV
jgi:hypothetical protein